MALADILTPQEVDLIPQGPRLDALVAERIMGWRVPDDLCEAFAMGYPPAPSRLTEHAQLIPPYSESMKAAWFVLAAVKQASLSRFGRFCDCLIEAFEGDPEDGQITLFNVLANLTPEAICKAALKAVTA